MALECVLEQVGTPKPRTPGQGTFPSPPKRYFSTALKISIILSVILLLIATLGPFGYPLRGVTTLHSLVNGLFFINSIISLCFYCAVVIERRDEEKNNVAYQQELQTLKWYERFKRFTGKSWWLVFMGLVGTGLGTYFCYLTAPVTLVGTLLIPFTGGTFLSFACRMDITKQNEWEVRMAWAALVISLLVIAVILLPAIWHVTFGLEFLGSLPLIYRNANWGFYPTIIAILSVLGFAQYATKAASIFNRKKKEYRKTWEYRLPAISSVIGITLAVLAGIMFNYSTEDIGLKIVLGFMIFSACASLAAKLGKSIDEAIKFRETPISEPIRTWLNRIITHPIWTHAVRPILVAGLFLTLGFATFGSSFSIGLGNVPNEHIMLSWALMSPTFAFSLLALAVALIAHLIFRWLKPSVVDIPSCQIIASADDVHAMLEQLEHDTNPPPAVIDALIVHIKRAKELFSEKWRKGLSGYTETELNGNHAALLQIIELPAKEDTLRHIATLKIIFTRLKTAEVDPTYKSDFSAKTAVSLAFTSVALFIGCLIILFSIFTGVINPFGEVAWPLSLVGVFGFCSWLMANYFLQKTSSGPYATWAVIFGIAWLTCLVLACAVATGNFVLAPVLAAGPLFGIAILLLFPCALLILAAHDYAYKSREDRAKIKATWHYRWLTERPLIALKVILLAGFLTLAFLSIATILHLDSLPQFGSVLDFAFNKIAENLGYGGFVAGAEWLSAFSIGAFSTASFIAFQLFKNILEQSPATTTEFNKYKELSTIIISSLKFSFTAVILLALIAMKSNFAVDSTISMLPVFLVITVVMPLFSGNIKLPYKFLQSEVPHDENNRSNKIARFLKKCNEWFNTRLGLKILPGKFGPGWMLLREVGVSSILAGIAAITAVVTGATTELVAPILSIGIVTTLFFRWGAMEWRAYHDPDAVVQDYMYSQQRPPEEPEMNVVNEQDRYPSARTKNLPIYEKLMSTPAPTSMIELTLSEDTEDINEPESPNKKPTRYSNSFWSGRFLNCCASLDNQEKPTSMETHNVL